MELAVIFPNEDSFYKRMGLEIYENYPSTKKFYELSKAISKIDLSQTLIYENSEMNWDEASKKIAVLVTSVAFYEVWKTVYGIKPQFFMGHGIGYLAALVCSETISLRTAIRALCGKWYNKLFIKAPVSSVVSSSDGIIAKSKNDIYREMQWCMDNTVSYSNYAAYAKSLGAEGILEIGPSNLICKSLLNSSSDLCIGYLDVMNDNSYILESFEYRKLYNTYYCVLRILGIITSTRNNNPDNAGYNENVLTAYNYVKSVADEATAVVMSGKPVSISEESFMKCIDMLKLNFKYKRTPHEEIRHRIEILEIETFIKLRSYFSDMLNSI